MDFKNVTMASDIYPPLYYNRKSKPQRVCSFASKYNKGKKRTVLKSCLSLFESNGNFSIKTSLKKTERRNMAEKDKAAVKKPVKKKPIIQWQLPMKRVLYGLAPLALAAVYFFGIRAFFIIAVSNLAAFYTEYLFVKKENKPVTSAVFVTGTILALSLPPTLPFWMAAAGAVFAVVFGKMVFGGFGRNVFNPAMVGRAFLYISFAIYMTAKWATPYAGFPGGIAHWGINAATGATPLGILAEGGRVPLVSLVLGAIPGCLGETSKLLIIAGGIYIVWKKAASYRIVVPGIIGMFVMQTILWKAGAPESAPPVQALFSGGFLFGIFFVATDPISAPSTDKGRWIFGAFVGIMTVLIRVYSGWAEGLMFAVLLGNMFNPIMDYAVKEYEKKQKEKAEKAKEDGNAKTKAVKA